MATVAETRLAWAVRAWDAEVENARRLASRANLVITVALAFSGAGAKLLLDRLQTPMRPEGWQLGWFCVSATGIALMFGAFVRVLLKRESAARGASASATLLPPDDIADFPQRTDPAESDRAVHSAFLATTGAAYELHARNAEERKRLQSAQFLLIVGAALTLLFGSIYSWRQGADGHTGTVPVQLPSKLGEGRDVGSEGKSGTDQRRDVQDVRRDPRPFGGSHSERPSPIARGTP